MSEKIYCGSGKKKESQYGTFRSITINLTDLPKEHMFKYNDKTYIKLNVNDKREVDQYGKDLAVTVDTWKPEQQQPLTRDNVNSYQQPTSPQPENDIDGVPF